MLIGYMRVSSESDRQSTDLQRDALMAAGVDSRHLFEDHASGAKDDRPGLSEALAFARPGDVLVVWKLDRLGRSLSHLLSIINSVKNCRPEGRRGGSPRVCGGNSFFTSLLRESPRTLVVGVRQESSRQAKSVADALSMSFYKFFDKGRAHIDFRPCCGQSRTFNKVRMQHHFVRCFGGQSLDNIDEFFE